MIKIATIDRKKDKQDVGCNGNLHGYLQRNLHGCLQRNSNATVLAKMCRRIDLSVGETTYIV